MLPPIPAAPRGRWDVFCSVVDNFGDAGVAWRLARQLAAEHDLSVALWIDEPRALARLVPGLVAERAAQMVLGVEVRHVVRMPEEIEPAEVVVEAFGCGLPPRYVESMVACKPQPQWFVLEYLTAEAWPETVHGLSSPHPRLPIARRFWWPGFTPGTGGLLRERDLFARRDAFLADPHAREAFARSIGLSLPAVSTLDVSLFCYPHAPVASLFDAWSAASRPVRCLVPSGTAFDAVHTWTGGGPEPGVPVKRGSLEIHAVPFLPQDRYDQLLWSCAWNFVRGEDSFVRAQWAALPLVWHIYPQSETAHVSKLGAFVERYTRGLDTEAAGALAVLFAAWNGTVDARGIAEAWPASIAALPRLDAHARGWAARLGAMPDLAGTLVEASRGTL